MASTPATSFSSDGEKAKNAFPPTDINALPSPQQSDPSDPESHHARQSIEQDCAVRTLASRDASDRSSAERKSADQASVDLDSAEHDAAEIGKAWKAIWKHFCGLYHDTDCDTNPTFHFERGQESYEKLCDKLDEHPALLSFFQDEIRHNWWDETGILTLILMGDTALHACFQEAVAGAITKELDRIALNPVFKPFRANIHSLGQARITSSKSKAKPKSRHPRWRRSPDAQFLYFDGRHHQPPLIIEVGYSQRRESLEAKMKEYFRKAGYCTLLGFDIVYPPKAKLEAHEPHTGSLSFYTSFADPEQPGRIVRPVLVNESFTAEEASSGVLEIPFELFMPLSEREKVPGPAEKVRITYKDLVRFLRLAEAILWQAEDASSEEDLPVTELGVDGNIRPPKRRNTSPPPEQRYMTRQSARRISLSQTSPLSSRPRRSERLRAGSS